ncbi:contractile injection system protein, VgrG/Pvc8 family [Ruegeria sp. 2012CJ41-6]|uniref:Contractile injection system protein, VgrG/Pvc8 family n=1 Tax=Ruegeria spongiae TaxID=2942209 RepID=A0ABT0Q4D5_9RHOB|nr:contractile injection system protein, VgrG/Pvc8 family [Ruegeria spongiae]MCL6284706.1 contractile injection system protein, VgrG/Pvc8 family [Ruegeria spongiae]
MTPAFKVIAAGVNITDQISERLLSLVVTDEAGFKSDRVEITLDDRDNAVELPLPGAPLAVFMGYEETFLAPMGAFTSAEVVAKGPPDRVIIRGKAANLGGSIKAQVTRAWDNSTLSDIAATIAEAHGLKAKVSERFRDIIYGHLDQTDESDINLMTRLAKDHDAIASVKGDTLVFMGKGEGKTAGGVPMPPVPERKTGNIRWSMTLATRGNFRTVEATWHNQQTGTRDKVTAGEGAPVKRLRHAYPDQGEAQRAARAKLDELGRGNDTLSIEMVGDPLIAAEGQILATGFRVGVSGTWSIKSARHRIAGGGFTTSIEAEKPKSETG